MPDANRLLSLCNNVPGTAYAALSKLEINTPKLMKDFKSTLTHVKKIYYGKIRL